MFINGRIFEEEPPDDIVTEASSTNSIRHQMKEEYFIRDKYFPYIESFLPKTEKILFRYIAKYEDKWGDVLTSPYPTKNIIFGQGDEGEDNDIVFRCVGINRLEMKEDIQKLPLPGKLTKQKAAFQPLQIVMYLMIRYYIFTKQPQKAEIIYPYYGYSIYWKRWSRSFPYPPNEGIMIYAVNNMSYRNLLKKLGSVRALLIYIVSHVFEYYHEGLAQSCDEDIRYILDQVQSDIGSKVNNIASAYYKAHDDNSIILKSNTFYDDDSGNQRLDSSISGLSQSYAQTYTHKFFGDPVNSSRVRMSCSLAGEVSVKEVEQTIEYVHSNVTAEQMAEFYEAIFYYYLSSGPTATEESIKSMKFITVMRELPKKANSIDKNVTTVLNYVNSWLGAGSNTFRLTERPATKTGYRKAVFNYFILSVTNK